MAVVSLVTLSSNVKLNPFPFPFPFTPKKQLQSTSPCIKTKLAISRCTISKHFSLRTHKPISIYGCIANAHNVKPGDTRVSASVGEAIPVLISESKSHRIWLSDVVVKRPKKVFFVGRKWHKCDVRDLCVAVVTNGLALCAPFAFNWGAFWVMMFLGLLTGWLGICLCYHRNLTHRSFKLPKWLEYFLAYCGALALQWDPITWVSVHRYHHQHCDSEQDPHSPLEGFWFAHIGWIFDRQYIVKKCGEPSNVGDLEKQPFYRFLRSTHLLHSFALGVILYAFGGLPYVLWGMGVRVVLAHHITWLVNSASHVWGNQAWNTGDLSKNNWWVALLTFGEGWHNNHHAFEYSARHGLEWWQVDMIWYVVRFLEAIGLATEVKLPTEAHKQRLAFKM